jgi:hypothetical protein
LLWLGSTVAIRQDYHSKKSAEKISRFLTEPARTVFWASVFVSLSPKKMASVLPTPATVAPPSPRRWRR